MGSYGIGVSRLVGAVIEASHDERRHHLARQHRPVQGGDPQPAARATPPATRMCEALYAKLGTAALYDDREERAGAKFADADLMGHPWQLIVGPRGAAAGKVELKRRATGERVELTPRTHWPGSAPEGGQNTHTPPPLEGGGWGRGSRGKVRRDTGTNPSPSPLPQGEGRSRPVTMFGPFERAVAGRYLRARKGERFVSIIAIFSLVGIALGVATLIVVTSVMSGFQIELERRILGVNGHIEIEAYAGQAIDGYQPLLEKIRAVPGIVSALGGAGWPGAADHLRAAARRAGWCAA